MTPMTKNNPSAVVGILSSMNRGLLCMTALVGLACDSGTGTNVADTGGMSGTGVSQGSIDSFGSIFVNGVEWEISGAQIQIDDAVGAEGDLRVGMVVRVQGDLDAGGLSGIATSVDYDDDLEGPIEDVPVLVSPGGTEKSFTILGRTVIVDEFDTRFDGGTSFASIARLDVVEVSGFVDGSGTVRASRIEWTGRFPADDEVELEGVVANLVMSGDGTGLFDIGSVTVEYTGTTTFSGFTEPDLIDGDVVEVKGPLVGGGFDRIDAAEIELEDEALSGEDVEDIELEGIVTDFVSMSEFTVAGFLVDASGASFEPIGTMIMEGDLIEVDGSLVAGVIVAESVEFEDESLETVKIEAAISAIDMLGRKLTLLDVEMTIDGKTEFEDERDGLSSFGFDDLQAGDWVKLEAISTGGGTALAKSVHRENADADVVLEGPVTALEILTPRALSVLGQSVPIDGTTAYFDDLGQPRTEAEFFENPGDVQLGDVVKVTDVGALQLDALLEADIVELDD
jgi:hypothetical protein